MSIHEATERKIRWMIRRDLDRVLDIESRAFQFPWDSDEFMRMLRQRSVIGMTYDIGDVVAGYFVYELRPTEIYVHNLCVDIDYRRQGIGREIIEKLVGKMNSPRRRIALQVCETNLDAQLFFRSCGFRCVEILRDCYEETDEDSYLMHWKK